MTFLDPEIVEIVIFLNPAIVESVDKSFRIYEHTGTFSHTYTQTHTQNDDDLCGLSFCSRYPIAKCIVVKTLFLITANHSLMFPLGGNIYQHCWTD